MKKLIIFDLDDTLLKTGDSYNNLLCSITSEIYSIPIEDVFKFKDEAVKESANNERVKDRQDFYDVFDELFLTKLGIEFTKENHLEFKKAIKKIDERFPLEVELFEDVINVLKKLKEKGIKLAILTGSHNKLKPVYDESYVCHRRERLLKTFKETGLDKLIDQHFFTWDYKTMKPDREAFYLPLNHFNVSSEDTIMVGDKDKDLMAKNFGMTTILFDPKGKYKKETKPDYVAKSFLEILKIVEGLN